MEKSRGIKHIQVLLFGENIPIVVVLTKHKSFISLNNDFSDLLSYSYTGIFRNLH